MATIDRIGRLKRSLVIKRHPCGHGVTWSKAEAEGVSAFLEKRAPNFPGRVSQDMPAGYPWWEA